MKTPKRVMVAIADIDRMSDLDLAAHVRNVAMTAKNRGAAGRYTPSAGEVLSYLKMVEASNYYGPAMMKRLGAYVVVRWLETVDMNTTKPSQIKAIRAYQRIQERCRDYNSRKSQWGSMKRNMTPRVVAENGSLCVYCGEPFTCIDHRIPLSRGGGNEIENLAPACRLCNSRKHDLTVEEFIASGRIK